MPGRVMGGFLFKLEDPEPSDGRQHSFMSQDYCQLSQESGEDGIIQRVLSTRQQTSLEFDPINAIYSLDLIRKGEFHSITPLTLHPQSPPEDRHFPFSLLARFHLLLCQFASIDSLSTLQNKMWHDLGWGVSCPAHPNLMFDHLYGERGGVGDEVERATCAPSCPYSLCLLFPSLLLLAFPVLPRSESMWSSDHLLLR